MTAASQVAHTWRVNFLWKEGGQLNSLDRTEEEAQKVRQKGHREQTHGKSVYLLEIGRPQISVLIGVLSIKDYHFTLPFAPFKLSCKSMAFSFFLIIDVCVCVMCVNVCVHVY